MDDRATLNGIPYVLRAGIPWKLLPTELGYGSGVTCWRRLREWQRRGVWKKLHRAMLDRLAAADQIDWSRAALDSRSLPAKGGGAAVGRNPTDKGKPGSKHHVLTDRQGIPLAIALTAANVHDSRLLAPLLDAVPAIRWGRRGRPRRRPIKLHADKRLRLPPLPRRMRAARHQAPDRAQGHRVEDASRPASLGRRADAGLDSPIPPPCGPVRAPRRHAPRLSAPRLRPDLLQLLAADVKPSLR